MAANVDTAIIKLLNDDGQMTQLVGDRVRFGNAWEEDDLPFVLLSRPDETEDYHLNGSSNLNNAKIEVDCFADTGATSQAVAERARTVLNNFRGSVVVNGNTTHIRTIRMGSSRREPELEIEGSDEFIRGVGLTLTVWYKE